MLEVGGHSLRITNQFIGLISNVSDISRRRENWGVSSIWLTHSSMQRNLGTIIEMVREG